MEHVVPNSLSVFPYPFTSTLPTCLLKAGKSKMPDVGSILTHNHILQLVKG